MTAMIDLLESPLFPPPPCGEGSGVGVAQDEAKTAPPLDARPTRSVLSHPHPYPPHKGEGADRSRSTLAAFSTRGAA